MKIITDERCTEYSAPGHPERPARVSGALKRLRGQKDLPIDWVKPLRFDDAVLARAHSKRHLNRVELASGAFDGDTPAYPNIFDHARRSVGGALHALKAALAGETAFSLLRPPGHHAMQERAMGFCYLNSLAISVFEALASGASNVAVFDFDVHHGNGTEAILEDHPHTAFFSIHQHPCFPGTGTENVGNNCFNYPVPPGMPREKYRATIERALNDLKQFKPDLVAVSAGFDAYARDPIALETLEAEDFFWIGESIRNLGIPFFSVLEGGYSDDLPELIFAYLKGVDGM